MDLDRLRIDRSAPARRRGRSPWVRRGVLLLAAAGAVWVLRAPLGRFYDRLTLPQVEVTRVVKTSPLAASAVAGTAANGYVVAARRAALSADTPGRVVEMNVAEGSVVRKGDVVARLYAAEYEAEVRRAEAELASAAASVKKAEADVAAARTQLGSANTNVTASEAGVADAEARLELSQAEYQRAQSLLQGGAGTKQEVDTARAELDRAAASLTRGRALVALARSRAVEAQSLIDVAEAALAETSSRVDVRRAARDFAQATLEKTQIRAPFDGIVVLKDAEVGEVVSPNSQGGNSRGSVVTMVDFQSLEVQVELPEKSIARITLGMTASIYLDAYPTHRYAGRVQRIWPTANRQKGSVELRVVFDQPDDKLRPEMGVRVVFTTGDEQPDAATAQEVILIPSACVVKDDGKTGVFVVERDRARWQPVREGDRRGERVVAESGLAGGETVIVDPPPGLGAGDRVRVKG